MDTDNIVQQLRDQRSHLDAAINALEGTPSAPRRGRPPKTSSSPTSGPRRMSAAARAKISAAQRARWAKQKGKTTRKKASAKNAAAKKASDHKGMSPAARKRLSELMKKRWADRKRSS